MGDPGPCDAGDGDLQAAVGDDLTRLGDVAELIEDEPRERLVLALGQLVAEQIPGPVEAQARVDDGVPGTQPADLRIRLVELVLDLADQRLEDILQGDDACGTAVLVDHQGRGPVLASEVGE